MITFLLASAFAADPVVYPVADYGLQVTMADKWTGIRYSDDDFQAAPDDKSAKFLISGVKTQDNPLPDDKNWAESLKAHLKANLESDGVPDPEVSDGQLKADNLGDLTRLRAHFDFKAKGGKTGSAEYLVYPVNGATVLELVFGFDANKVKDAVALWEKHVAVLKPAEKLEDGPVVKMEGASTDLPAGFHLATKTERNAASYRTEPLGVKDLEPCWIAVSPRGMYDPALLVGCPIYMRIGIFREKNFAAKETDLRTQLFGKAPIEPGKMLALADRTAVQYHVPLADKSLDLVVVPDSTGLARFWALGKASESALLATALDAAVKGTTFEGPHPVSADDMLSYYPMYEPMHPYSLAGFGTCLASILGTFGLIFLGARLSAARRAQDPYGP